MKKLIMVGLICLALAIPSVARASHYKDAADNVREKEAQKLLVLILADVEVEKAEVVLKLAQAKKKAAERVANAEVHVANVALDATVIANKVKEAWEYLGKQKKDFTAKEFKRLLEILGIEEEK